MLNRTISKPLLLHRFSPSSLWYAIHIRENSSASPSNIPTKYGLAVMKKRIHEWAENTAATFKKRTDSFTLTTKLAFSKLGSQLNKVSGYEEIEALKKQVVMQETLLHASRRAARQAKAAFESAMIQRSNSQREVNDLLQRKSSWTESDVSRFTALVRQDHTKEQEEARAKSTVSETEDAVDREFSKLMRLILARYHEEQVWSDKIRSVSTYGSLVVLGLNVVVFIVAITVVEPWKRRRLAQSFEKKVVEMSLNSALMVEGGLEEIGRQLDNQRSLLEEGLRLAAQETQPGENLIYEAAPSVKREDLGLAIAASAFVAGVVGWLARGWFGI